MKSELVLGALGSIIFVGGFWWLGSSISSLKRGDTIDVTGVAEKIISMDSVELQITINNKGENIVDLYKKRVSDRNKVLKFIKDCGINEQTDVIEMTTINSPQGEVKQGYWMQISRDQNFSSEDKIKIRSKNIAAAKNIASTIDDLSSEDMTVTAKSKYYMEDKDTFRDELLKEAVKDARCVAETIVGALGKKITGVDGIRFDQIDFRPVSGYSHYDYDSESNNSPIRKATAHVNASFAHN